MVNGNEPNNGNGTKKRSFFCSKEDILPEESFKTWKNYLHALSHTGTRLKDRILARSLDSQELNDMLARSHNHMKKTLNWWDLIWFGIGSVMGAGIFVLTGQATKNLAGPAVVLSYLISGLSALLSVLCYTEFSVELPVAGGSFAYLLVELGDFVAYVAAANILFEYMVSGASVARSWTSYFATLCSRSPNDFRVHSSSLAANFSHLDPIAVLVSVAVCMGASLSVKGSSRFNSFAAIVHMLVLVFVLIAGLTKANPANMTPFVPFGVPGILKASAVLFFAYVGFDGVATLGEEVKNPGRDIPIGLIGSMLITITAYCALAATLCLMVPYGLIDVDAPFTVAFQSVGMDWAKYIVAIGALKGMTTVLLANLLGQARYFTHIARTHMAPPILAAINERTGTPVNATVLMTVANSLVAFFTSLDVLANLLSISTLFIFTLVAAALIVRRHYVTGETSETERKRLIVFMVLIIGSSIGSAVYWKVSNSGWIGYIVTILVWFSATLGIKLSVKEVRKPKTWGVPMIPWLPSASIAINVFIMGSIDGASFLRFLGWTGILLVYYVFVALHASYDAAREAQRVATEDTAVTGMEGGSSL